MLILMLKMVNPLQKRHVRTAAPPHLKTILKPETVVIHLHLSLDGTTVNSLTARKSLSKLKKNRKKKK